MAARVHGQVDQSRVQTGVGVTLQLLELHDNIADIADNERAIFKQWIDDQKSVMVEAKLVYNALDLCFRVFFGTSDMLILPTISSFDYFVPTLKCIARLALSF